MGKKHLLGLTTKKEDDFADWYAQVLSKAELIDYHDVSGCYILRPNSYQIWEFIQSSLDKQFKKDGVVNAYFPLFISKDVLEKEKTHLDDFSPEVAWVTKAGDKSLNQELAIRPTSETSMYPYFAKWLQSYRDLPIKINQWNNVVRWEFKSATPFIRSREFLWQEGHTAHMFSHEAEAQVIRSLRIYEEFYKNLLCVEVIPGFKTPKEKFAGSEYTLTVEAFIPEIGRGIQTATSHYLGQNFSKMFNIIYEDPETKDKQHVYQTSWGLTTRSIGTMIMTHSDNIGLVLPPNVASCQVVIIPVGLNKKTPEETKNALSLKCQEYATYLNTIANIRCHADIRDHYTPPWKYNHWEMRGIPLRIELGPTELLENRCTFVKRVSGEKITNEVKTMVAFHGLVKGYLKEINTLMYKNSQDKLTKSIVVATKWDDFLEGVINKKMIASPFCQAIVCENDVKQQLTELGEEYQGVKTLCVPLKQDLLDINETNMLKCINVKCDKMCDRYTMFGKSY